MPSLNQPQVNSTGQAFAKPRIFNCHTHIFTADHVPPRLGRTFLPLGLDRIFTVGLVVRIGKWWFKGKFIKWLKHLKGGYAFKPFFWFAWFTRRYLVTSVIANAIGYWITIYAFLNLFLFLSDVIKPTRGEDAVKAFSDWFHQSPLYINITSAWLNALMILYVVFFFPSGRNLLLFVFKKLFAFLSSLPGKQTREYLKRYLNLGRFAIYEHQYSIYSRLNKQYPPNTGFVILPMDMEYMGAGSPPVSFYKQMEDLISLKEDHRDTFYPFVFIHPERMKDKSFFAYELVNGRIVLNENCAVRQYIETHDFSGFKIYPALGYYPFDEVLLPLWRYAADNGIPIMTHCIIGTIFYRGPKLMEWNTHPIFEEVKIIAGDEEVSSGNPRPKKEPIYEYASLKLMELDNKEFQRNFTHPLNYLCLLDDSLLMKVIEKAKDKNVRRLFYDDTGKFRGLQNLKICFGHFGGDDEWKKYFELDREDFVHQLTTHPQEGINFFQTDGHNRPGKIAQLWNGRADWYSIICSIMLQYPNVYADISYIIHNIDIFPLLRHTMSKGNERLRRRVLFGTDFYVVRNYKSERNMLVDVQAALSEEEFDLIARENPVEYLSKNSAP